VQTAAAATWSFEHGLGEQFPVFTIFDDNNDVIIPTRITADNAYTASIYFSSARTGTAVAANCGLSGSTFDTAISSSYALTASFALDFNPAATASYALEALTSSFAQTASYVDPLNQIVVLTQVSESLNFADDAAAALGGVPLGGLYRNGNFILIRLV
jgi:multisubunit Na+/H+ antiporter MnhC subunit